MILTGPCTNDLTGTQEFLTTPTLPAVATLMIKIYDYGDDDCPWVLQQDLRVWSDRHAVFTGRFRREYRITPIFSYPFNGYNRYAAQPRRKTTDIRVARYRTVTTLVCA